MREIKFRAWHKNKKRWIHSSENACNILGEMILCGGWCAVPIKELNHVVVMQYTGLKDKNGKEIYEGDIVTSSIFEGEENENQAVVWDEAACSFNTETACLREEFDFTVIGNIYENPELLK